MIQVEEEAYPVPRCSSTQGTSRLLLLLVRVKYTGSTSLQVVRRDAYFIARAAAGLYMRQILRACVVLLVAATPAIK
jgi:hypothetical protein